MTVDRQVSKLSNISFFSHSKHMLPFFFTVLLLRPVCSCPPQHTWSTYVTNQHPLLHATLQWVWPPDVSCSLLTLQSQVILSTSVTLHRLFVICHVCCVRLHNKCSHMYDKYTKVDFSILLCDTQMNWCFPVWHSSSDGARFSDWGASRGTCLVNTLDLVSWTALIE